MSSAARRLAQQAAPRLTRGFTASGRANGGGGPVVKGSHEEIAFGARPHAHLAAHAPGGSRHGWEG